jgi:serine/threonine protein kinase/beta-lactam-binding protein with PASTA domain
MSRRLGGRYELQEQVGGGGMAVVYRALDTLLGRTVAVKMLRPQYVEDDEFISRFRQEAQSAAKLSHPNIVNIYDVGMTDGEYYIVMEFVNGPTLKDVIRERGPLSPEETIQITRQICDALEHAHSHHIVHRDIKPHNILLTKTGQVKVTDFGIARAMTGNTLTYDHSGSVLGSVHYLSPEQARGGAAGVKSDIYSLGVVMYEMLTGRLPFQGDSAVSVALKHLRDQFVEPRQIKPDIPQSLENIVLKCLVKSPDHRYSDMRAMKRDLNDALQNPDVPKFVPPGGVTEETIAIPAITDNVPTFEPYRPSNESGGKHSGNWQSQREQSRQEEERRGRRWLRTSLWVTLAAGLVVAGAVAAYFIVMGLLQVPNVKLPNVVGKSENDALQTLEQAGFGRNQIREQKQPSSAQPKGTVFDQDPAGNTEVKKDRPITLYISTGAPKVNMPDLSGVTLDQAKQQLINLGFAKNNIRTKQVASADVPAGQVVSTNPPADTMVSTDRQVVLSVSRGQPQSTVPSVIGKSLDEASKMLVDAKLVVGQIIPISQPGVANGTVVDTAPNHPGDTVSPGTAIDLYVAENGSDNSGMNNSTGNATSPTGGSDNSAPPNAQEHDVTVSVDGSPSGTKVVILKSDSTGANQQVVSETIQGHKDYQVTLYLAPHHNGEVDVYIDGKLAKKQKVKYDG